MFLENLSVEEIKINALHLMINDLHINGYFGGILHPTRREMGNIFNPGYSRQGIFYPPPFNKLVMFYFMRSEKDEHGDFQKEYLFQEYQKRYLDFWQSIGIPRVNFIVLPFFKNRRDLINTSRRNFFQNFIFVDALDIPMNCTKITIDDFSLACPTLNARSSSGYKNINRFYRWPFLLYLMNRCNVGVRPPNAEDWIDNHHIFRENMEKFSFWNENFNWEIFLNKREILQREISDDFYMDNDDWAIISESIEEIDHFPKFYLGSGGIRKRSDILRNTSLLTISSTRN